MKISGLFAARIVLALLAGGCASGVHSPTVDGAPRPVLDQLSGPDDQDAGRVDAVGEDSTIQPSPDADAPPLAPDLAPPPAPDLKPQPDLPKTGGPSLLPNPGFESDLTGYEHDSKTVITTSTVYAGSKALMMPPGANEASNKTMFHVTPGKTYTISVWARTGSGSDKPRLGVWVFDAGWTLLRDDRIEPTVGTSWTQIHKTITAKEGEHAWRLYVQGWARSYSNPETLFFDNLAVCAGSLPCD
jgi:hypothetical protein